MLRNAKVSGVDLAQVNSVASLDDGFEQFQHEVTARSGQESLDVLEDKRGRANPCDQTAEFTDQRVASVGGSPHPRRRKTLARRTSDNDRRARNAQVTRDRYSLNVVAQIGSIRFDRRFPVVECRQRVEARANESQREAACPAEQVDD